MSMCSNPNGLAKMFVYCWCFRRTGPRPLSRQSFMLGFSLSIGMWEQLYSNPGLISASNQCHPRPTSFNLKDLEAPTGLLDLWTMCASLLLTCFPFFPTSHDVTPKLNVFIGIPFFSRVSMFVKSYWNITSLRFCRRTWNRSTNFS